MTRTHGCCALVLTCCLSTVSLPAEESSFLDRRVDIRLRAQTLGDAIYELTSRGEATLAAALAEDPALAVADTRFEGVTVREALDALCTPRRLRWRVLGDQLVIDRPLGAEAAVQLRQAAQTALVAREPVAWARVLDRIGGSGDLRAVAIAIDGLLSNDTTIQQLTKGWLDFGWCCLFYDPVWGMGIGLRDDRAGLAHLAAVYGRADAGVCRTLHRLLIEAQCDDALPVLCDELISVIAQLQASNSYKAAKIDKQIEVASCLSDLAGPAADDLLWEWWSVCIEADRSRHWPKYQQGEGSFLKGIGAALARRGDAARREAIALAWDTVNSFGIPPNSWGSFAAATATKDSGTVVSGPATAAQVAAGAVGSNERLGLPVPPPPGSADHQQWLFYYMALAQNRSPAALDRLKQHALDGSPQHQAAMATLIVIPCPQADALWAGIIERLEAGMLTPNQILEGILDSSAGRHGPAPKQILPVLRQALGSDQAVARANARRLICRWLGFPLNTKRTFFDLESVAELADLLVASIPENATSEQRERALRNIPRNAGHLPAGSAVAYLKIHQCYLEPEERR